MEKSEYILGISCLYHDSAAVLLRDGDIIAAAQEERFTRKKHDASFPKYAVKYCFEEAGITIDDVTLVAFYDKPLLKFERLLETYGAYAPRGVASFIKALSVWMKEKLWIPQIIEKELGYSGKILYPEHHQSHAASAFFPSPYERAAFLTIDGVGEWATASWGVGEGNRIDIREEIHFPHSLGLLYSAFTYYLGFKVNSGEYKVMGLAPYGKPIYVDRIKEHLIDIREDGSFALDMSYFNYPAGLRMTNKKFHDLFDGPPRKGESELTQRDMDIARSLQVVVEEVILKIGAHIKKETNTEYLVLAGGVALNCVANGKLLKSGLFKDIWIQPAGGDAGGALGAALFAHFQYEEHARTSDGKKDQMKGGYLGPSFDDVYIETALNERSASYVKCKDEETLCRETVGYLKEGKVVGWFQGRMEFGPRALGHRSILGDPQNKEMQSKMNLKIKFRESFRPFAPSVLEEAADEYFHLDGHTSPYMLLTTAVREGVRIKDVNIQDVAGLDMLSVPRSTIPAVTHVDYSARVQTVSKEVSPRYHQLLKTFQDETGCGVLVNTSFNVRGEPVVCMPEDAYRCFMRTHMDVLVVGNYILKKEDQPEYLEGEDWQEEYELD